jgi:hypothetical protein
MKTLFTSLSIISFIFFISCKKTGNGPLSPGDVNKQGNVDIKSIGNTWIKDDEHTEKKDPVKLSPHFYSNKSDVKLIMNGDNTYQFQYTSVPNGTRIYENGSWSYDASSHTLTMFPQSSATYTYRIAYLDEEQLQLGNKYPTYDSEGVKNGDAEEIVWLEDND